MALVVRNRAHAPYASVGSSRPPAADDSCCRTRCSGAKDHHRCDDSGASPTRWDLDAPPVLIAHLQPPGLPHLGGGLARHCAGGLVPGDVQRKLEKGLDDIKKKCILPNLQSGDRARFQAGGFWPVKSVSVYLKH